MTRHLIEAVHSKWGVVKAELVMQVDYIDILYPDGDFAGGLDKDLGGSLGHPNKEVDRFLRLYHDQFPTGILDLDPAGYQELEMIYLKEIERLFPNFINRDHPYLK